MLVKVRALENVPFLRYLCFVMYYNISVIPTYRVYRLYDIMLGMKCKDIGTVKRLYKW